MRYSRLIHTLLAVLAMGGAAACAHALQTDQIALIVNRNVPEGQPLAEFYAHARGIPDGRIIELDLPSGDQIPFETYERDVAGPVRRFLRENGLDQQVRCLVTFYGVPLRIAARAATPDEQAELTDLRAELLRVQTTLGDSVQSLEKLASRLDASFRPQSRPAPEALARRGDQATRAINSAIQNVGDDAQKGLLLRELAEIAIPLTAPIGDAPTTQSATGESNPSADETPDVSRISALVARPDDPDAREHLRTLIRRSASPFAYERLLQEHIVLLNSEHTDSALDSELALVWVERYSRAGWQPNPLGYPFLRNNSMPKGLMVMRLDAPTPEGVRRITTESITIEREGLKGSFVVDSRGIAPRNPDGTENAYAQFDQRIRELATFVKSHTKLEVVHDDGPEVLLPDSVTDVALYCGWYSVSKYVPAMKFAPGAVGYHVASFELTTLRDETNTGWCRGMLTDGVAATLGPVSEPLLHAFPVPDDFFPLLMTGRLTLAEVYWRTTPLTSWKMCMIGDPLYVPFRSNPAIGVEALPQRLQGIFQDVAPRDPAR